MLENSMQVSGVNENKNQNGRVNTGVPHVPFILIRKMHDQRPTPRGTPCSTIESIKEKFSKMQRSKSAPISAGKMERSSSTPTLLEDQDSAGSAGSGIPLSKQEGQGQGEEAKLTPKEEGGPPTPRDEGR